MPSTAQVIALSEPRQQELVRHLCSKLSAEIHAGGWQVLSAPTWVLKGTTTTDSHEVEQWTHESQITKSMIANGKDMGEGCVS
jgi:hypothetical protein